MPHKSRICVVVGAGVTVVAIVVKMVDFRVVLATVVGGGVVVGICRLLHTVLRKPSQYPTD